jgi:hypothetical protein
MSRKQEIYKELLRWDIPHIRDQLARGALHRMKDTSALLETELIHSLPNTILDEGFVDGDLWFLNNHARDYLSKCSPGISKNYDFNRRFIAELFTLVPPERRAELKWAGPPAD